MRQLFNLLALLICMGSAPLASARNSDFAIDDKWSFYCKDAHTNLLFQKLVRTAVRDGLSTLASINPTLYKSALSRAENGYPLKWSCDSGISSTSYANAFFTPKSMINGDFEAITLMPNGLKSLINAAKPNATDVEINKALAILFHEYLHYLGFDNVSPDEHRDSRFISLESPVDVSPDVVVACSALAFPSERNIKAMSHAQASCEACARARVAGPNSTRLTENPNEIMKSEEVCRQHTYEHIRVRAKR